MFTQSPSRLATVAMVSAWLAERCERREGCRELAADLYADFKIWSAPPPAGLSPKQFGDALRDLGLGVMGKDARGLKFRGPVLLRHRPHRTPAGPAPAPAPAVLGAASQPPADRSGPPSPPPVRWGVPCGADQ